MLFEQRLRDGIADGTVTVAFRRWRRRQVVPGGRYRTGADMIEVDSVDIVEAVDIGTSDATLAGYPSPAQLLDNLRGSADLPIYRIAFHRLAYADPREVLASADKLDLAEVAEIDRRLDRMDRSNPRGAWTAATLSAIANNPAVSASVLAASFGLDKLLFKRGVRTLKNLGLTHSLPVGYRLSPRGAAYLRLTSRG
jgi:hypothetical protein